MSKKNKPKWPTPSDPLFDEVVTAICDTLNWQLDSRMLVYVLSDFSEGRPSFRASDKEIAAHTAKLLRSGKLQTFLRMAGDSEAEVEAYILELERDFKV